VSEAASTPSDARRAGPHPSAAGLLYRQFRYQNRIFWRTPIAAFFTLAFPLMFLILFNLLFSGTVETPIGDIAYSQFFTPAIAVFAVVTACYTNMVISLAIARDEGILKRFRGTPLPPWIFMAGRITSSVWIGVLAVVIMFAIGAAFYDVQVFTRTMPAAVVTFLVGAACFCALGLAVAGLVPSGDASPAVANATLLPLAFLSGIFIPLEQAPSWVATIGDLFPLKHFVDAFGGAFNPFTTGSGFAWDHLGVMAAWGVAGMAVALRFFAWEPRRGGERRGARRTSGPSGSEADASL
jgi:ABC-2 type transport system permease protein